MKIPARKFVAIVALLSALQATAACTGGGGSDEDKYEKVFSGIDKSWKLYEVKKEGDRTIIRVEVSDVVPLPSANRAMEELKKVDPKLSGYIEFYNNEVGIVLRKVEIVPST